MVSSAVDALAADRSRRLRYDPVAFLETAYAFSHRGDRASKLVTKRNRHVDSPRLRAMVLVNVAAADSHAADTQQNLVAPNRGNRNLAQLDLAGFRPIVDERRHRICAHSPIPSSDVHSSSSPRYRVGARSLNQSLDIEFRRAIALT